MKFFLQSSLLLMILTSNVFAADSVEVMAEAWWSDPETSDNSKCINLAYDLETETMDATSDSSIRVRKSHIEYGISYTSAYCHVKFYSSATTSFSKETFSYNQKKCEGKKSELDSDSSVVWSSHENRTRLEDGSKGCKVHVVRFIKI